MVTKCYTGVRKKKQIKQITQFLQNYQKLGLFFQIKRDYLNFCRILKNEK